ncbi:latent-transforming growth factor beta-binding protein 2-like isoform X2 [Siniperca chuatsi]|uniref:latent-transforming growth factor beta-binding protein 2-like isoform X2 n=1 Tax=Siniperca chuatsi TaxID=119488 RepID=UPI001CE0E288|nr:latent-transforming growth factor beta-binding protein 2-like isoform X2 [Siniperca chuatsi]
MPKMDRAGFAVLMVLAVALVRIGDSQKDTTGGRKEGAGAGRAVWDQEKSRVRSQSHSPRGPEDGASPRPSGETSPGTRHSRTLVRLPRGTSTQGDGRHISTAGPLHAAGGSREDLLSAPRDGALRGARHPANQHRTKVNRRQSSKPSTRRLVGPNVCGGQQCCSGWALAPGTNRCIKPDCQPPCQNRGSCSRPHTCVCRSGFQGPRCEEVAPEQVYIRDRGALRRIQPGTNPFQKDQPQRKPSERQAIDTIKAQTPRPLTTRQPVHTVTQVRRGPPDSSPQQTGTSRTVKRYPSSSGPITSNALPSGNGYTNGHGNENRNWHGHRNGHSNVHSFNTHRPTSDSQLHRQFNNALLPAGANLTSSLDRIKIVFTPMLCRRVCSGGHCYNSCEKGDITTVYSETSHQQQQQPKNQGFRLFFCQIPCLNGGRCIGRDLCWCPSNSTGKFCHLPVPPPARPTPHSHKDASLQRPKSPSHSMYTLPLSNQQVSLHPSLVNVHIQHPPEAEVHIHQVARVQPGQRPATTEGAHSVQQRSQPGNGHEPTNEHSSRHPHTSGNGHGHARPHNRQNGHVGRCFQETVDGQCGKPLPGLTKQDDCCGSVGASWGLNKCQKCPTKPAYAVIANGQVECSKGFKRMNLTHCQDINECLLPGICKNAECLNAKGSYRCTCKPGFMLDAARSHCVSDKAVSDQRAFCYRSVSAGTCSLPLAQHITKQICCCSRVGKAWGPGCDRCPLPGSDHFKEICPAGHGYTYSRSDVQISLRQLGEDDLQSTGVSWEEQSPTYPQPPSSQPSLPLPQHPSYPQTPQVPQYPEYPETPQAPQYPEYPETPQAPQYPEYPETPQASQYPEYPETPQAPQYPEYPETPQAPQYPEYPETPQAPQYPEYPETPQAPWYPLTPQQPFHPSHPARETPKQLEDVEILSPPAVVTDSPLTYPETSPDSYIISLRPDSKDTTHTDSVTGIDKCATTPAICGHGKCIPVQTGYTCHCEPGFKLSALQTNCIDVNECDEDPCEGKAHCINNYGSYTCQCHSGYSQVITQNRKFCQDVDECRDPSSCPNGVCVNTLGSFQCQSCGPGFRPADERCVDVNECLNQTMCGPGRCVNTEGSYRCNCFQGYKLSLDSICQDVDECVLPGVCLHGRCVNLDGTHKCTCNHGYQVTSDSKACEDVNECATGNVCPTGICINTAGSYNCQNCRPGFGPSADGLRCEDVDECAQGDLCLGGVCANTEGSYTCTRCKAGYRVSQDRQRCEDIDECLSLSTCANGICLNTEGSYTCENCPTGYRVSYDGELCEDIDECALPTTCPQGTCTNTEGSFTCVTCQPGFRVSEDGQQCDDVDECLVANTCLGQLCLNTLGSYTCRSCGAGLQLSEDGYSCEDIDECQTPGVCPMGVCTNTEGSFSCMACDPGFTVAPNGLSCEDVNECEDNGLCLGGQCTNNIGSYSCSCPTGLELVDGTSCRDINECLTIVGICGEGDCLNTEGSYTCICPDGYTTIDGRTGCQDVDECSKDNVCIRGQCLNTDGSFLCLCEAGFKFNADTADCEDQNECKEFGSSVCGTWRCENTIGSYRCFMGCQPGLEGEDTTDCDIDECVNETICGNHGFCENTDGSFRCQCDQGYTNPPGDMSKCVDVNECEMSLALCREALCENYDGSFLCICPNDNEEFDPITSQCRSLVDIDPKPAAPVPPSAPSAKERKECYYNLNDANFCDNVLSRNTTKQECCCTVGAGWGDNCEIHACPVPGRDDYNQLCPHGSGLLPLPVSSTQSLEEQRPYIDANECEMFGSDICKNGQCKNLFSTYTCYCRSGFYYDNIRLECVDYDECGFGNACENGVCVNTAGSFNCFCSPPLVLDSTRRHCIGLNTTEETLEPDHNVHMDICWQGLEGDNMCSRPYQVHRTTYTECCCLYGIAWSGQCAFCPRRDSEDYIIMCNLPRKGGSDSLRERPGYEYGNEGPEDPVEPFVPPYFDSYGNPAGPYDIPESVPLFNDNDYSVQQPLVRVPVPRPQEHQPQPVDSYAERYDGFEGLRAEECGILNGCENGRCVRVREGYTCDCFDGYEFDLNKMACIDINECEDISDKVPLCQNGQCTNTEGSYKCTCLPGFVASAKPHECIPAIPESGLGETGN